MVYFKADHTPLNCLKAVFHKFYLVHSWIRFLKWLLFWEIGKSWNDIPCYDRSSRTDVFFEKGVLRNFAKFTWKHLCQSLFLIEACNFIKGIVRSFLQKNWKLKRKFFRECNLSGIKLYISVAILRKKWKEAFKYTGFFVFLWEKFLKENEIQRPQNLKKMLQKSPASNVRPSIFKNADFC